MSTAERPLDILMRYKNTNEIDKHELEWLVTLTIRALEELDEKVDDINKALYENKWEGVDE